MLKEDVTQLTGNDREDNDDDNYSISLYGSYAAVWHSAPTLIIPLHLL
jgi:hypothetical protein